MAESREAESSFYLQMLYEDATWQPEHPPTYARFTHARLGIDGEVVYMGVRRQIVPKPDTTEYSWGVAVRVNGGEPLYRDWVISDDPLHPATRDHVVDNTLSLVFTESECMLLHPPQGIDWQRN